MTPLHTTITLNRPTVQTPITTRTAPHPAFTDPLPSENTVPSPTVSQSSVSTSDSSISYAYNYPYRAYIHSNMSRSTATVEHPVTKHCPILTGGETTPQTFLILENTFNEFFIAKGVSKENQVKFVLGAFKCVHIRDWIATDREHILTLTFDDFMSELRKNFLPSDWVETVKMSLLGMQMSRNTRF